MHINRRRLLIMVHDLVVTAVAIAAAFYLRFEEQGFGERAADLAVVVPCLVACALPIYWWFDLYRG